MSSNSNVSEAIIGKITKGNYTEEELKKSKRVIAAGRMIFQDYLPIIGGLCNKVTFIPTPMVPTIGVPLKGNGKMYYNPEFISKVEFGEMAAILLHEIDHIIQYHADRVGDRNFRLWNVATDYAINVAIDTNPHLQVPISRGVFKDRTMTFKETSRNLPICLDSKYQGMSSEDIYDDILEKAKNNPQCQGGGGDGDGQPQPLEVWSDEESGSDQNGSEQGQGGDGGSNSNVKSSITEGDIRSAISRADETGELDKAYGSHSSETLDKIRSFCESGLVDYRNILADYLTKIKKQGDRTYSRYNRRSTNVIRRGRKPPEALKCVIALDSSGSMGGLYEGTPLFSAISEIASIISTFPNFEITVLSVDTEVFISGSLSSKEGHSANELLNLEVKQWGGTDMNVPINWYMDQSEVSADLMIILTDGWLDNVNAECNIPVLLITTPDGNSDFETPYRVIPLEDLS